MEQFGSNRGGGGLEGLRSQNLISMGQGTNLFLATAFR